jgi:hypothetical protein
MKRTFKKKNGSVLIERTGCAGVAAGAVGEDS